MIISELMKTLGCKEHKNNCEKCNLYFACDRVALQIVIKIRINKPYNEYTVLCPNNNIDNYYYTSDLEDAIGTAKAMYGNDIIIKKVYAKQN